MGQITRALILNGQAAVTAVEGTDIVRRAQRLFALSPLASAALGRTLIATAYLGSRLKNKSDGVTVNIKGNGPLGAIVAACDGLGNVRGYVENPQTDLPLNQRGKLDVSGGVGKGRMSVVRDLGLKEPFVAQVELESGEIAEDFTKYFAMSEQSPSVVALGVLVGRNRICKSAGGVFIHMLPGASEEAYASVQQLSTKLTGISLMFEKQSGAEVLKGLFEGSGLEVIGGFVSRFKCKCSRSRIRRVLLTIQKDELLEIVKAEGSVKVTCHFCGKEYKFGEDDVIALFDKRKK